MNVEIGAEAALFPGKEYINGIAVAVCMPTLALMADLRLLMRSSCSLISLRTRFSCNPADQYLMSVLKHFYNIISSVGDPCHFGVDPDQDLRIHASDLWVRMRIRILLFSS
jgi:hypothetical protein